MKKKILLFVLAIAIVGSLCACGEKNDVEKQNPEVISEQIDDSDYMTKHIKSITPENREEFLSFWQASVSYCKTIALELKNSGNTNKYEFDPTDSSQVPEEISGLYDFSRLNQKNSRKLHKDFIMTIDGSDVTLSYDGIDVYPTTYAYSDIQGIIDALK